MSDKKLDIKPLNQKSGLKLSSGFIFTLIILSTILSYTSIFFPYYTTGVSFDNCLKAGPEAPCMYGEILHIFALILGVVIIGIIMTYFALRYNIIDKDINGTYRKLSIPLFVCMIFVFILSLISLLLATDLNNLENNNNPEPGVYIMGVAVGFDLITVILMAVHIFVLNRR